MAGGQWYDNMGLAFPLGGRSVQPVRIVDHSSQIHDGPLLPCKQAPAETASLVSVGGVRRHFLVYVGGSRCHSRAQRAGGALGEGSWIALAHMEPTGVLGLLLALCVTGLTEIHAVAIHVIVLPGRLRTAF